MRMITEGSGTCSGRGCRNMWVAILWWICMICRWSYIAASQNQQCLAPNELSPCLCTSKKNGLDILCEYTDEQQINRALQVLKGSSTVIFYLKLRHNNLPKLQGLMFYGLDVRHLTVHNNSVSLVDESSLISLGKGLTQLDLSLNELESVPTTAFRNLNHLLILNLNQNRITAIQNKAFEGLDKLEILTLYENKIVSVDPDAFRGLDMHLKLINLGGNELLAIPTHALSSHDLLKRLEIQENRITQITEGDFLGLHTLDFLNLGQNHLKEIPAKVFSNLKYLISLELDGNQISLIDTEAFTGLEEKLQYLKLGDNNIKTIPSDALRRLYRLRHLDLQSNNISGISDDAFTRYGDTIISLNLQKNDIKKIPSQAFQDLNSLEILNMRNTKLMEIRKEVMQPILDTLLDIDITDNPLVCGCDLLWYREWTEKLTDSEAEGMMKKTPTCEMLSDHRRYSVLHMPLEQMNCGDRIITETSSSASNMMFSLYMVVAMVFLIITAITTNIHMSCYV